MTSEPAATTAPDEAIVIASRWDGELTFEPTPACLESLGFIRSVSRGSMTFKGLEIYWCGNTDSGGGVWRCNDYAAARHPTGAIDRSRLRQLVAQR